MGVSKINRKNFKNSEWQKVVDNVTIPLSNGSYGSLAGSYLPTEGWDSVSLSMTNSANTSASVSVDWSFDGVTLHFNEIVKSDTNNTKGGQTPVKAPYFRVYTYNADASASHTFNTWFMLKD